MKNLRTVWKMSKCGVFFWSVFSCIRTKSWKIRTRKTPYLDTFHAVLYAVQKAVAAILHHSTTNEDPEKQYQYFPRTIDSWCKFQRDKITSEKAYKENISIKGSLWLHWTSIFLWRPCSNEFLKECQHNQTQNVNEWMNLATSWFGQGARKVFMLEILFLKLQ